MKGIAAIPVARLGAEMEPLPARSPLPRSAPDPASPPHARPSPRSAPADAPVPRTPLPRTRSHPRVVEDLPHPARTRHDVLDVVEPALFVPERPRHFLEHVRRGQAAVEPERIDGDVR